MIHAHHHPAMADGADRGEPPKVCESGRQDPFEPADVGQHPLPVEDPEALERDRAGERVAGERVAVEERAPGRRWRQERLVDPLSKAKKVADDIYLKAIPYFEKAHELKPDDKQTTRLLKVLYAKAGNTAKFEEMKKLLGE